MNVANIDIIIGTASTKTQFDTQVCQSQEDELGFYWLFIMLVKDMRKDFCLVFFYRVVPRYYQLYG